jgi:Flp pilus assembly protein TadG
MKLINPSRRRERGTQIAEFAVVLPLLAFLAMVVTEGAGFIRTHQVLNNVAREGARLAAQAENSPYVNPQTDGIIDAMYSYAQADNNKVNLQTHNQMTGPTTLGTFNYRYTWAAGNNTNATWKCQTITITINQGLAVPTPSGLSMSASQVIVNCGYQLQYLPNLPFFSVGVACNNGRRCIPLSGSAEFRNFY